MKLKFPFWLTVTAVALVLLAFVNDATEKDDFESAKEIIIMRKIAHRILQYAGDTLSPVMPVKQLSTTHFRIPFESSFTFQPDSLVAIIDRVISANGLPANYIVNVKESGSGELVYGYAFLGSASENIVPCSGRKLPVKQYFIDIKFRQTGMSASRKLYLSGIGLFGAALLLFGVRHFNRRRTAGPYVEKMEAVAETPEILIGKFRFYPADQFLLFEENKIVLTAKESKLLSIFATNLNQTIDRNRLQKEVWEDEGVIVGRSLDMFISKLRKKLEPDAGVKISNIHGRGYKLEIF